METGEVQDRIRHKSKVLMGNLKYKEFKNDYPELHGYFCFLTEEEIVKENLHLYEELSKACDHIAFAKLIYHKKEAILFPFAMEKRAKITYAASRGDKTAKRKRKLINAAEGGDKNPFPWCPTKINSEFGALIREFTYIILELQKIKRKIL